MLFIDGGQGTAVESAQFRVILAAAFTDMSDKIAVRSKWTLEELLGESVEFKLPIIGGEVHGIGQLIVARTADGLLTIDIRTVLNSDNPAERGTHDFHLNQWATDRIERHPNKGTATFRCIG